MLNNTSLFAKRRGATILLAMCWLAFANAQQALPYDGLRVCLFDFEVLQSNAKNVVLRVRAANTGRQQSGVKKMAAKTVIELDTFGMPPILWGMEQQVANAGRNNIPNLKPGEISAPFWIKIFIPNPPEMALFAGKCPDLVFDTAYIHNLDANTAELRYVLRNAGSAPVEISGKTVQLAINVYFVAGSKLTRGAIQAGGATLQPRRESITGWLLPNQRMQGDIPLKLENRTKFVPNFLLELAPPPSISECDRTNNIRVIELPY